MKNKPLLILFTFLSFGLSAQEICDNGIDDDADGLIDLNDNECSCSGFGGSTPISTIIPNPSFEDTSCCPSNVTQLTCADIWIQASNATSDYFNLCDYTGIFNSPDTPLPGGGAGYGGFYSNQSWEENIGVCLSSPLTAGTSYSLKIWTTWSTGSTNLDLTIFGTPNCGDLPWNTTDCPIGNGSWMELGSTTVTYSNNQSWQQVSIIFTPTVDINAISIGGPCGGMSNTNYYFIDDISLFHYSPYAGTITESGNWCSNDLLLIADSDTSGGTWQWYKGGVAIPGEISATLDLMSYGAGDYTAVYSLNGDCIQMDHTVILPPFPAADFTSTNQCVGNAINFIDNSTIAAPGVIEFWNWDFGDGNSSSNQNPSHTYANDGAYTVNLTVTDSNGCTHDSNQVVTVFPLPQTDFEFEINGTSSANGLTGGCIGDLVNFVNNSTINTPNYISGWNWDFGNGNTSTDQNPLTQTYSNAGNFTIQLTTTSNHGCTNSFSLPISISGPTSGSDIQTACDSYTWINGNTYSTNNNSATHTLTNAAGCDSVVTLDLTIKNSTFATDTQTACDSYTWIDGNTYTSSNNTATHTLTNVAGCDSVVTLDLTINSVSDVTTTQSGITITSNNPNASYAWLDCDSSFIPISGETAQSFTATENGNYAVQLSENGCIDTSACVAITTVGIIENTLSDDFVLYPNPTSGEVKLVFESEQEELHFSLYSVSGELIESKTYYNTSSVTFEIEDAPGTYIVKLKSEDQEAVIRVVKE